MEKVSGISGKILGILLLILAGWSCSKDDSNSPVAPPVDTTTVVLPPFDVDKITDTYASVASIQSYPQWGPYNVHDPSIFKDGEYFYCYNSDVAYGSEVRLGIQIRKSKDLVDWKFVGWVFNALPPQGASYIKQNGGTPNNAIWAPYIIKVSNEYRLYYSLASNVHRLSAIGLATASSPTGPWKERGVVVTSENNNSKMTNAIDPTVLIDQQGKHWMYYGSAWDGIYILKLDGVTGLAESPGSKGKRISQRGSTGGKINGNIEGPEIIYNKDLNKYFLFISYDWLSTKYNVRVGRSDFPDGPFLDYNGRDLNLEEDHIPMILAPYQFQGHSGWQGTAHCSVFADDNGQYYMAHQGRPGVDFYYMVLHVRKMYWSKDGWPIVSPERYSGTAQTPVKQEEIIGKWEQIVLGYRVVPGYDKEQISPDFQTSVPLQLDASGSINGDANNQWKYEEPWLELKWGGVWVDKLMVERGRDWENKKPCLIFTGLNNAGTAIWGKKN